MFTRMCLCSSPSHFFFVFSRHTVCAHYIRNRWGESRRYLKRGVEFLEYLFVALRIRDKDCQSQRMRTEGVERRAGTGLPGRKKKPPGFYGEHDESEFLNGEMSQMEIGACLSLRFLSLPDRRIVHAQS